MAAVYSFDYDVAYDPAMPIVEVEIRGIAQRSGLVVTAIVDSGADGTLVPMPTLRQLGVPQAGWVRVKSLDGLSRRIPVYLVQLSIGALSLGVVRAGGDRAIGEMIVGRDVLNHLVVTLNGLANVVQVSQEL